MVSDKIKFETFVDAQGTAFQEYLSTVIAKLPKTDKDYRSIQDKIESRAICHSPVPYQQECIQPHFCL